jgi:hypothetical protein
MYMHAYIAYIYKINDSNDTRNRREKLLLLYYYKIVTLPVKWYSVIWAWVSCKYVSNSKTIIDFLKSTANMQKGRY